MRRDHIVRAVDNLREALQHARIREILRFARNGEQPEGVSKTQKVLLAYNVFSRHYQQFGEQEKELMSHFGLAPLLDINFWSSLIDGEHAVSRKVLADVDVGAYNVIYVMPRLRELLIRDNDQDELTVASSEGVEHKVKRVRVFIAERARSLTDPQLIINVIRSIEEMYESLTGLRGDKGVSLVIGSIDSGSVKSIDFFGASDIMQEIDTLLLDVWDRLKYSNEENYRYQIEVALMAAGFVNTVNDSRSAEVITEEQGQRITRRVAKAIETLFKSGAYTQSMDEPREVRASNVLVPKTELIEYKAEEKRQTTDAGSDKVEPIMRSHEALLRELGAERSKQDEPGQEPEETAEDRTVTPKVTAISS